MMWWDEFGPKVYMPLQQQDPERGFVVFLIGESLTHHFPMSFDLISEALLKSLIPKSTKHSIFNLETVGV